MNCASYKGAFSAIRGLTDNPARVGFTPDYQPAELRLATSAQPPDPNAPALYVSGQGRDLGLLLVEDSGEFLLLEVAHETVHNPNGQDKQKVRTTQAVPGQIEMFAWSQHLGVNIVVTPIREGRFRSYIRFDHRADPTATHEVPASLNLSVVPYKRNFHTEVFTAPFTVPVNQDVELEVTSTLTAAAYTTKQCSLVGATIKVGLPFGHPLFSDLAWDVSANAPELMVAGSRWGPRLDIEPLSGGLLLCWPYIASCQFGIELSTSLGSPQIWVTSPLIPVAIGDHYCMSLPTPPNALLLPPDHAPNDRNHRRFGDIGGVRGQPVR